MLSLNASSQEQFPITRELTCRALPYLFLHAIFGLTKNPYIVVTANIFALMGLRQLYFLIGDLMKKLIFLSEGLSAILAFIGVKLLFEAAIAQGWHKVAGIKIPEIGLGISLGFILFTLLVTTAISLWSTREADTNK